MSSPGYSFPPESYSAVYVDGKSSANGAAGLPVPPRPQEPAAEADSPPPVGAHGSLFSCFRCAIPKRIRVIRKNKNEAKSKVMYLSISIFYDSSQLHCKLDLIS